MLYGKSDAPARTTRRRLFTTGWCKSFQSLLEEKKEEADERLEE